MARPPPEVADLSILCSDTGSSTSQPGTPSGTYTVTVTGGLVRGSGASVD